MSIKILHTSDWHLGKKLVGKSRITEQQLFIQWLKNTLAEQKVDILIISGDIFDTPYPPTEAIKIFLEFLQDVSANQIEVFIIGGNHDSGKFLEVFYTFFKKLNINIVGGLYNKQVSDLLYNYKKNSIELNLLLLPFFKAHEVFDIISNSSDSSFLDNLKLLFENALTKKSSAKNILISHHLFGPKERFDSSYSLPLPGIDSIPSKTLSAFDLVLLGHIHNYSIIKKEGPLIIYSGAPIPMKFHESMNKVVNIINIDEQINHSIISIPTFRNLISLEVNEDNHKNILAEIEKHHFVHSLDPWFNLSFNFKKPSNKIINSIRDLFSNMKLDIISSQVKLHSSLEHEEIVIDEMSTTDLFEKFYFSKFPESKSIPSEIKEDFNNILLASQNSGNTVEEANEIQ